MNDMRMINADSTIHGGFEPASRMSAEQRIYNRNNSTMMNMNSGGCSNDRINWNNDMSNNKNMNGNSVMQRQTQQMMPSNTSVQQSTISLTPETMTNTDFLPAYLSQYIGNWIRADFFIGDTMEQRVGVLHEVGASYIIIEAIEPATLIVCDIFSLRFVTVILDGDYSRLLRF